MEVNIKFNTENEPIENLKKLGEAIQKLIDHREGKQVSEQVAVVEQKKVPDRTSGGCRVIPYEDMSEKMNHLLSGRRF